MVEAMAGSMEAVDPTRVADFMEAEVEDSTAGAVEEAMAAAAAAAMVDNCGSLRALTVQCPAKGFGQSLRRVRLL